MAIRIDSRRFLQTILIDYWRLNRIFFIGEDDHGSPTRSPGALPGPHWKPASERNHQRIEGRAGEKSELIRASFLTVGVYEERSCVSMEYRPQNKVCVADHCVMDVSRWLSFDKTAHLFVDLFAMKAIFSGIQTDLSSTPQIGFADFSISQSIMSGCIRSRSIQSPDSGDHYASKSCIHARKPRLLTSGRSKCCVHLQSDIYIPSAWRRPIGFWQSAIFQRSAKTVGIHFICNNLVSRGQRGDP